MIPIPRPLSDCETIVSPGPSGLKYIEFSLLRLDGGESYEVDTEDRETVVVLLGGDIDIRARGESLGRLARRSVFEDPGCGAFLPPHCRLRMEAAVPSEVALASAISRSEEGPYLITRDLVQSRTVGRQSWERRVDTLLGPENPGDRLIVGETYNPPGHWSSFPPHKHDRSRPPEEYPLEEVYHYRVQPAQGFGIQMLYTEDGSSLQALVVRHGDTVPILRGYHPVAAPPGYNLYYLWMLAGDERRFSLYEDPDHRWIAGQAS